MRLRTEVVHLDGLHLRNDIHEIRAIAQVAVMQLELAGACASDKRVNSLAAKDRGERRTLMLVLVEVVQASSIEA